jgi:hypothetical protein
MFNIFLKTALGPNVNLNRVTVFDPVLFTQSQQQKEMQERYAGCFSQQLEKRIIFHPEMRHSRPGEEGKFIHFVDEIENQINGLFF